MTFWGTLRTRVVGANIPWSRLRTADIASGRPGGITHGVGSNYGASLQRRGLPHEGLANKKIGRTGMAIRTAKTEMMMAETYKFSSRVARVLRPPSRRLFNILVAEYARFTQFT
jgi:hypothetical protein